MYEVFLDKYEKALILKFKSFQLKIDLNQIEEINEGFSKNKKFLNGFFIKKNSCFLGFFYNFGIKYLFLVNLKKELKTITIKLKNCPISYIVISLPEDLLRSLKLFFQEVVLSGFKNTKY